MTGIFGIISNRPMDINEHELSVMHTAIVKENFYKTGSYICNELGVYVGWISIADSFSDCMPVTNEKGDIILIYSGENYKDLPEINELKGRKHQFSKRNASYLVHMYEELKDNFFQHLNGVFHGILLDLKENKVILFNDRFGLKKIYYHENENGFYFSYHIKPIKEILSQKFQVDENSLAEYFAFNCIYNSKSLFKEIYVIPGGSYWIFFNCKNVNKNTYFKLSEVQREPYFQNDYYQEKCYFIFKKILSRYFRSEETLGIQITNDYEIISILANAMFSSEKVPCFYFSGKCRDIGEEKMAKLITEITGQSLHKIWIDDKFFKNFSALAEKVILISDGIIDVTRACELYMYQIAREFSSVLIFGTQDTGLKIKNKITTENIFRMGIFNLDFQAILDKKRNHYNQLSPDSFANHNNDHISIAGYGRLKLGQSQVTIRTPLLDYDFLEMVWRSPNEFGKNIDLLKYLIKTGSPRLYREMNLNLKWNYKKLLKKIKGNIFKQNNICEEKGNTYNIGSWYRNELAEYIQDILLERKSLERFYINKNFVRNAIINHIERKENFTDEISILLTVELMYRIFLDR
jgi:asparagine synthase (glutamine-hydrolysing)